MTSSIIEIRVAGTGTDISPRGGSGGGGGGLLAVGGKLGLIAGAAMAVVSILKDMLWVFKPVQALLKMIARTLGLFLEPIAQFATALLQPILAFIRPMALLFRAMMAPVMGLVREYSGVMSAQIGSGDMLGAAQTGTKMVTLMLGGFFISLGQVIGDMLITSIGGAFKGFTFALIDLAVMLISPITILLDKFIPGVNGMTDALMNSAEDLKTGVANTFDEGIEYAKEALRTGTNTMMEGWINTFEKDLEKLKNTIEIKTPEAIDPFEKVLTNTGASVAIQAQNLQYNVSDSMGNMEKKVNLTLGSTNYLSIPNIFNRSMDSLTNSLLTFTRNSEDYARRIRSALSTAESAASSARSIEFNLLKIGG